MPTAELGEPLGGEGLGSGWIKYAGLLLTVLAALNALEFYFDRMTPEEATASAAQAVALNTLTTNVDTLSKEMVKVSTQYGQQNDILKDLVNTVAVMSAQYNLRMDNLEAGVQEHWRDSGIRPLTNSEKNIEQDGKIENLTHRVDRIEGSRQ